MPSRKPTKKRQTKKASPTSPSDSSDQLLAFVADVHIGNHAAREDPPVAGLNTRCTQSLAVFGRSIKLATDRGAGLYVSGGDLLHVRRPEPAVLAATNRVLEREAQELATVLIPGNHEMLDATAKEGNTACEPLYSQASVPRLPEWFDLGDWARVLCVPFHGEVPMAEYLIRLLPEMGKEERKRQQDKQLVMATHVGVFDESSPQWLRGNDAIRADDLMSAMQLGDFTAAFVGNFHQHQVWRQGTQLVVQVGTLCPASYSDEGIFPTVGGMALYDGSDFEMVQVPGPRYIKADGSKSVEKQMKDSPGCTYHVRAPDEEGFDNLPGVQVEVVEDKPAVEAIQGALPQAEDAGEAIENYIQEMTLAEGVDRPDVLKSARQYWKQAAG